MHEHDAASVLDERQRPIERRVATAQDHDILIGERARILHTVMKILALELVRARYIELARLEGPDTPRDHHGPRVEDGRAARHDAEAAVFLALDLGDFLSEMKAGAERFDLLE